MTVSQDSLTRLNKVLQYERRQMDTLRLELAEWEARHQNETQRLAKVTAGQRRMFLESQSVVGRAAFVHDRVPFYDWTLWSEDALVKLRQDLQTLASHRDACRDRLVAQRSRVRGLELLIEKRQLERDTHAHNMAMIEATDRAMQQRERPLP